MQNLPIISGYTAALSGLLLMALTMRISSTRAKTNILIESGDNEDLLYKIRAHANLAENAPVFLILLTLYELVGGSPKVAFGLAGLFILARIIHLYAMSGPSTPAAARAIGVLGTMAAILGAAGALTYLQFGAM